MADRCGSDGVWSAFYTLRGDPEEDDRVVRVGSAWDEIEKPAIEGCQPATVAERDGEEMGVGHLAVADDPLPEDEVGSREVDVVGVETMFRQGRDPLENIESSSRGDRPWNGPCVRRDSDEYRLGCRARCPAGLASLLEPRGSRFVVYVIRPRQRHQDVDVEEGLFQASSSASRTISEVIGGASAGTSNTGKPPLLAGLIEGARPRRARSERTLPSVDFLCVARLAAAL